MKFKVLGLLLAVSLIAAVGKSTLPVGVPLGYRTQINVLNSLGEPYTGALVFRVNGDGTVSGDYESDSVRPDPLYGRLIPVTGTVSGNQVLLQIGNGVHAFSMNGTISRHSISGSATQNGRVWTFSAMRVHLQNPPAKT
jgi:hypothetical protein